MSERRVYETTYIVNAALEDSDIENVISKVAGYIENHGGQIQETDKWGRRRLAYPINKKYNGYYVHMIFEANASTIPILERFMILEDTILRHLTVILPEKLRKFRIKRAIDQQERLAKLQAEETVPEKSKNVSEDSNTKSE
jgi:small subunit ribosomal protein S6